MAHRQGQHFNGTQDTAFFSCPQRQTPSTGVVDLSVENIEILGADFGLEGIKIILTRGIISHTLHKIGADQTPFNPIRRHNFKN